jgi:hypothetical protein
MSRQQPRIISDSAKASAKAGAKPPISSQAGDGREFGGHHRYYGNSATFGERITETRRGPRPRSVNLFGF